MLCIITALKRFKLMDLREVKDTTGAGDTFNGAFAGLQKGYSIAQALNLRT